MGGCFRVAPRPRGGRNDDNFQSHQHVPNSTVFQPLIDENGAITKLGEVTWCHKGILRISFPQRFWCPLISAHHPMPALETASDLAQHFHAELYLLNVIPMLPMGTKTVPFPETEYLHKAEGNAEQQL